MLQHLIHAIDEAAAYLTVDWVVDSPPHCSWRNTGSCYRKLRDSLKVAACCSDAAYTASVAQHIHGPPAICLGGIRCCLDGLTYFSCHTRARLNRRNADSDGQHLQPM